MKNLNHSFRLIYLLILLYPYLSVYTQTLALYSHRVGNEPICKVQIFGERCSGTNFLHALLRENIDIGQKESDSWYYYGWKHFPMWLHVPYESNPPSESLERNYTFEGSENYLFVVIFRDPYDWIRSIHRQHHHLKPEMIVDFKHFIRSEWFSFVALDTNPVTGGNFENGMKLRTERIKNMLLIKDLVKNIYYVRYEILRDYPQEVLKEISEQFNITLKDYTPIILYKGDGHVYKESSYDPIEQEDLDYINSQLDSAVENSIGYQLIEKAEEINTR